MVDMEISSKIMKSPLENGTWYSGTWSSIQWHPPLIRHFTISWPCYRTGPYYRFWCYNLIPGDFHTTLQRVRLLLLLPLFCIPPLEYYRRLANRGRLLIQTPGPVSIWTCICSNWDHSLLSLSCLRTIWVSNIPQCFYFAVYCFYFYFLSFRGVCQTTALDLFPFFLLIITVTTFLYFISALKHHAMSQIYLATFSTCQLFSERHGTIHLFQCQSYQR